MALFLSKMAASFVKLVFWILGSFFVAHTQHSVPVKEYVLNLNLPEEDRWTEIIKKHNFLTEENLDAIIRSVVPSELVPAITELAGNLDAYLPSPFAGEIKGIAKAANISLGYVFTMNVIYEATAFCTSIVAQDSNSHIWHGRNLDYGSGVQNFTALLRKQAVTIHVQSNNKTVYTATTFVGFTGIVTGMKPHAFTVTLNERDQGSWWENLIIALFDRKALPDSFLVRRVLETATSYQQAMKILETSDTIADAYLIVGGVKPGEGAVITKKHIGSVDIWPLNPTLGRWYVLETNFDHWKPPGDNRRVAAMKAMNTTGNVGFNITALYKVLSVPLVLNEHTAYTSGMSAAFPQLFMSWVRYP